VLVALSSDLMPVTTKQQLQDCTTPRVGLAQLGQGPQRKYKMVMILGCADAGHEHIALVVDQGE
jgi:hypothetical protein